MNQGKLMSTDWRRGFPLIVMILALIVVRGVPAWGQDPVFQTSSSPTTPILRTEGERIFRESEVRRIVEDVLKKRERELKQTPFSAPSPVAEESFSLSDFISQKLTVHLGDAGRLKIYGYGRGDLILATSRLNNAVIPFFALSEDPANLTPAGVPIKKDDAQFNANVRLTRVGLDYDGPRAEHLANAKLSARVEIDFETLTNITSESRAVPRIRLAYAKMAWGELSILAGQNWDVVSPLFPTINNDGLMWLAGNLGDRRPMFKTAWNHEIAEGERLLVEAAISSGGAIDRQDLDKNGIKDGEDSGIPALQTRIGYAFPSWVRGQSAQLGVWGFAAFQSVEVAIAGQNNFVSRGLGIDWSFPLFSRVTWRGEAWYGRDLSDWRGGIGQGVNTSTGEEIESHGGWTELLFQVKPWWKLALGGTMDNPTDNDLLGNTTTRTLNWTWYVGNRFSLGGGLSIAFNVEAWHTEYLALSQGTAMRFKTWVIQRF